MTNFYGSRDGHHSDLLLRVSLMMSGVMKSREAQIPYRPVAMQDFAQWLVQAHTDLRHPPCDPEWNTEAIVNQAR